MLAIDAKDFERRKKDSNKLITRLEMIMNEDKDSTYKSLKSFMLEVDKGSYAGNMINTHNSSNYILDLNNQLTVNNLVTMASREGTQLSYITHLKLSNNLILQSHLEILLSVIKKGKRVEIIDLNYCGIKSVDDIVDLIEAGHTLDYLKILKVKEARSKQEYFELTSQRASIIEALKRNVSIVYLELTEENFENDFRAIQNELEINILNEHYKSQLRNAEIPETIPLELQNIKLCRRFGIKLVLPEAPTKEGLALVHQYLELPDHKIRILDGSNVHQPYIRGIIRILNHPTTNYSNLDIITFGYRALHQKEFIFFGKWLLKQFSNRSEGDDPKIIKYLGAFKSNVSTNKTLPEEKVEEKSAEIDFNSSIKRREGRKLFGRSNTSEPNNLNIIKTGNEEEGKQIEVSISVTRKLFADDLKVIWLITQHCNKYLYLNLKAKEFEKESDLLANKGPKKTNCCTELLRVRKEVCSFKNKLIILNLFC